VCVCVCVCVCVMILFGSERGQGGWPMTREPLPSQPLKSFPNLPGPSGEGGGRQCARPHRSLGAQPGPTPAAKRRRPRTVPPPCLRPPRRSLAPASRVRGPSGPYGPPSSRQNGARWAILHPCLGRMCAPAPYTPCTPCTAVSGFTIGHLSGGGVHRLKPRVGSRLPV